jgi:predicted MFS family arabinose efflux permease
MSILWRSWLIFTAIIATIISTLALLSYLQFNVILSNLIQQRLSVVAQTTAGPFSSVVNLGLPFSMVRNTETILKRGQETDERIIAIHAFNPSGIIVGSTDPNHNSKVPDEVIRAQAIENNGKWSIETPEKIFSGLSVSDDKDQLVGSIVVVYPKDDFNFKSAQLGHFFLLISFALFCIFSLLALIILRLRLSGAIRGFKRMDQLLLIIQQNSAKEAGKPKINRKDYAQFGLLGPTIEMLEEKLVPATIHFQTAKSALDNCIAGSVNQIEIQTPVSQDTGPAGFLPPNSALANSLARRLAPLAVCLITGSALILGVLAIQKINRAIEPEIASRTRLIGTIVNANIQRAVSAGVPLKQLVGAEQYFGDLLENFREVGYIGVATGRIILEAGKRQTSIFGPKRSSKDELSYPIRSNGEEIGYIIVDIDPEFIARQFRDVIADLIVVMLVAMMLTFEQMIVMMSRSLAVPLERLQTLVELQAAGNFSNRIDVQDKNSIDRLGTVLSQRANTLHKMFAQAIEGIATKTNCGTFSQQLSHLKQQFCLSRESPAPLIFSYLNDIRWPLFLFVAAEELPLSFFPIFTRAAENPWLWLDEGVVISLPLIGYLIAILIASPFARLLTARLGHRNLLLIAMAPAVMTHIGLYFSTTVPEIIIYRTISGLGYAIATLACQDYVIDLTPKEQRTQTLGSFTAVLVGSIFCGTAIGGILADRLGQNAVFLVSACLVSLSWILVLFMLAPGNSRQVIAKSVDIKSSSIMAPLANGRFAALVFGIAIPANVLMQAFIAYLVALYMNELGFTTSDTGQVLMSYFLMIYMVGPAAARFFDKKFSPAVVTVCGASTAGLSLLIAAIWATQWAVFLAVIGAGIGHGMVRGYQIAEAMQIAETKLTQLSLDAVLGALRMWERGGSIVGLFGIAWISDIIGYSRAIGAIGLWILGGVLLFIPFILSDITARFRR